MMYNVYVAQNNEYFLLAYIPIIMTMGWLIIPLNPITSHMYIHVHYEPRISWQPRAFCLLKCTFTFEPEALLVWAL